jgi:topoisomerase-4 subunit A
MSNDNEYIDVDLMSYAENSYFDYSMYVILDRALPSIEDGLKPVQRRILFSMHELNLSNKAKYKKSARTIGDCLGKYHPHGDSACYEAMVIMAQPFNYRYPLIDGQGNWGSQDDPKSFAAMRYTESRLTSFSSLLLSELGGGSTDYSPNFDGTLFEPVVLPSKVPNIFLNSVTGIAVGVATEIPPHNLAELVDATKLIIDNPSVSLDEILSVMPGPDFPTAGYIVTTRSNMRSIYESGNGTVRIRAKYVVESKNEIVITELPYKVQGEKIIEQLAQLMQDKKLPMVEDLRDESNHENAVRIVIILKSGVSQSHEKIMDHVFSISELEVTRKINLNMIGIDGRPEVKPLIKALSEWIVYRKSSVIRRYNYRLGKIDDRLHLIEGLIICFLNLDEVIAIIRESKTPKDNLISRFNLSEIQANYILDTKLRNLAKLEEIELIDERKVLEDERASIVAIINSDKKLSAVIKKELDYAAKEFSDDRRSEIVDFAAPSQITDDELTPGEPITVIISKNGWIRAGKGHQLNPEALQYKTGDGFGLSLPTLSNKDSVLFDSTGRSYTISSTTLPSAKSLGDPITSIISPEPKALIVDLFSMADLRNRIVISADGYGFICGAEDFHTRQKKGKVVLTCDNSLAIKTIPFSDEDHIAIYTNLGGLIVFGLDELSVLKKGKGLKLLTLSAGEVVKGAVVLQASASIVISGSDKVERMTPGKYEAFKCARSKKPKRIPKTFGDIVSVEVVDK